MLLIDLIDWHNRTNTSIAYKTEKFSVFTWRHGGHAGVHNNNE